jgi:hypothetical protein
MKYLICLTLLLMLPASAVVTVTYSIDKKVKYKKAIERGFKNLNKRKRGIEFIRVKKNAQIVIYRGYEYGGYGWHKNGDAFIGVFSFHAGKTITTKIAFHEVFHIRGAKHNDNPLSIMYRGNLENATVLDSDLDGLCINKSEGK